MTKSDNRKTAKLLGLLALGGLIGTIITLLLAPRSGKETRTKIKTSVHRIRSRPAKDPQVRRLSNWGNYPQIPVKYHEFEDVDTLRKIVVHSKDVIPRGNGRCYGDSALAPQIISCLRYNKFLSFDEKKGILRCQSGVLLSEILDTIVPQGWFLPVTPGTKLITVGGAIASNVHGKSQHKAGNFSEHILDMELMLADGTIVICSASENADLFWATCGGMGLTGIILNARLKLIRIETAYIRQEEIRAQNLDHMMDLFEESEGWTYSVAWIDCLAQGKQLGRGFLVRGEHATLADLEKEEQRRNPLGFKAPRKLNVPLNFPNVVLNTLTVKVFNELIFRRSPGKLTKSIETYDTFFYPLDSILNWNRIYGKRGFTQYQLILPQENSREGLTRILNAIAASGMGSFLAVLKLYRQQNGDLPFAVDGYSLALDFPITDELFGFLDRLDEIVLEHGGRLYLTKDVRMIKEMFMQSYPNVDKFIEKIKKLDRDSKFRSFQSDRVGITQ